eukprot:TRINITY_DN6837_c0_g1_i4.p1 TRINITY_DN6837_c0_g1~~TRINITY_DN6837_c0_g1_i4.p1  ORF type:complete len:565 (-),score=102.27 TRINITY_DN6837_c0_g1_i4:485-2005(-)
MALALKHVHDHGVVHMDVKPDNFFMAADKTLKLGDFGISVMDPRYVQSHSQAGMQPATHIELTQHHPQHAHHLQQQLLFPPAPLHEHDHEDKGEPAYVAPEFSATDLGPICQPADIFSLGAILLELAADINLPTRGDQWMNLRKGRCLSMDSAASALYQSRSAQLRGLIERMIQRQPSARPTIDEVLDISRQQQRPHQLPKLPPQVMPTPLSQSSLQFSAQAPASASPRRQSVDSPPRSISRALMLHTGDRDRDELDISKSSEDGEVEAGLAVTPRNLFDDFIDLEGPAASRRGSAKRQLSEATDTEPDMSESSDSGDSDSNRLLLGPDGQSVTSLLRLAVLDHQSDTSSRSSSRAVSPRFQLSSAFSSNGSSPASSPPSSPSLLPSVSFLAQHLSHSPLEAPLSRSRSSSQPTPLPSHPPPDSVPTMQRSPSADSLVAPLLLTRHLSSPAHRLALPSAPDARFPSSPSCTPPRTPPRTPLRATPLRTMPVDAVKPHQLSFADLEE